MSAKGTSSQNLGAYLEGASGNPYAILSSYDEDPVDMHRRKIAQETGGGSCNPYATLSLFDEDPVDLHLRKNVQAPVRVPKLPLIPRRKAMQQDDLFEPRSEIALVAGEVSKDSTAISKDELEKEFEQVLDLYKPYVARDQWSIVRDYRSEFLEQAMRNPETSRRVIERLRNFRFSLGPQEKVAANRGPAVRLIAELKKLLA